MAPCSDQTDQHSVKFNLVPAGLFVKTRPFLIANPRTGRCLTRTPDANTSFLLCDGSLPQQFVWETSFWYLQSQESNEYVYTDGITLKTTSSFVFKSSGVANNKFVGISNRVHLPSFPVSGGWTHCVGYNSMNQSVVDPCRAKSGKHSLQFYEPNNSVLRRRASISISGLFYLATLSPPRSSFFDFISF